MNKIASFSLLILAASLLPTCDVFLPADQDAATPDGDAAVSDDGAGGDNPADGDTCSPTCTDKCGGADNGCGGTCTAACPARQWCSNQSCIDCTQDDHCGMNCMDCTAQAQNKICIGSVCGCRTDTDCDATTCNTVTHLCNCTQDCVGRAGGAEPNGCGSCGTCPTDQLCSPEGRCCIDCAGSDLCGGIDDGCGGICGNSCTAGKFCEAEACWVCNRADHCGATCINCSAQATNKACVNGACGCNDAATDCALKENCVNHLCSCAPDCAGKCGGAYDGCGGTCEAPCPTGEFCESRVCLACNVDGHCGPGCIDCSAQATNTACVDGACGCWSDLYCPNSTCDGGSNQCNCAPNCAGRECGPDSTGCGDCGHCGTGQVCTSQGQCCTPDCTGKCSGADNNCGGWCVGTCPSGQWCYSGFCMDCISSTQCGPNCDSCLSNDFGHKCIYNFQTGSYYCGCESARDCTTERPSCLLSTNYCTDNPFCVPDCTSKTCAQDDGCGAPCGCPAGLDCLNSNCVLCSAAARCGFDCVDCTHSTNKACVFQSGIWTCGCVNAQTDCPPSHRCVNNHCVFP